MVHLRALRVTVPSSMIADEPRPTDRPVFHGRPKRATGSITHLLIGVKRGESGFISALTNHRAVDGNPYYHSFSRRVPGPLVEPRAAAVPPRKALGRHRSPCPTVYAQLGSNGAIPKPASTSPIRMEGLSVSQRAGRAVVIAHAQTGLLVHWVKSSAQIGHGWSAASAHSHVGRKAFRLNGRVDSVR